MRDFFALSAGITAYGLTLTPEQEIQFEKFYELLTERNRVMNLTTITEWEDVVAKHFLDSLALLRLYGQSALSGKKILDLGTGAGFPGIPLAILLPETTFLLTDALQKRIGFLSDVREALSLSNVTLLHGRAEDLARDPSLRETFDLVISRAVANLSTLSEYCLPFVKIGGAFIAYKSEEIQDEVNAAERAITLLGGDAPVVTHLIIPRTELPRSLVSIQKKKASPEVYPRKAGTPAKKPLS